MSEPATSAQLLQQGLFHHRQGQLAQAMERYTDVLRTDPQNADALYYVAVVACQEGQFRQGVDLARRALEFGPPQARVHNLLGKAHEQLGDPLEAIKAYDQAIALDASFAEAHGNRAALLAKAGLPEQALASFDRALALDPEAVPDWINRGALLQELGRHAEALDSYDRALTLAPDHAGVMFNRANALAQLGRFEDAEAGYDAAIKHAPKLVAAYVQKGIALKDHGRHADALASFDQALAIDPDNTGALKSKARLLYVLGRLDEALVLLEKASAIDPADVRNYFDISEMKRFAPDDPQLAAMEKLQLDNEKLPLQQQIELHFAMAKAYRDTGNHQKAFQHLRQGNALNRQRTAYDEGATLGRMDRTRTIFTPKLIRENAGRGDPSDKPIFIIGMPRSGTTLIEQILASHPRVHGGGERGDFADAIAAVTGRADYPEMVPAMTPAQFGKLGETYLTLLMAEAPASVRITDKLPGNFAVVGLIHLALPHARIIHVQRDPIDTCVSCYSKLFGAPQDFAYDLGELGRYYRAYERLMEHWRQVLPDGVMLDVRYENVVADLETQARRIVGYCELEWDDACLSFHTTNRPVNTASAAQVRRPLYSSSVGHWRVYAEELKPLLEALESD